MRILEPKATFLRSSSSLNSSLSPALLPLGAMGTSGPLVSSSRTSSSCWASSAACSCVLACGVRTSAMRLLYMMCIPSSVRPRKGATKTTPKKRCRRSTSFLVKAPTLGKRPSTTATRQAASSLDAGCVPAAWCRGEGGGGSGARRGASTRARSVEGQASGAASLRRTADNAESPRPAPLLATARPRSTTDAARSSEMRPVAAAASKGPKPPSVDTLLRWARCSLKLTTSCSTLLGKSFCGGSSLCAREARSKANCSSPLR
mmetsp:Transcript_79833/g.222282  ORF Transcript_79833/g.222282 Transcript_79833/m.222282 type:complete len:261 (-) Transcript_79833:474-1256(-)